MRVTYLTRINQLRKNANVSQKELADAIRISPRTYCDYENGRCKIPLSVLIDLARFYNVDLNYISGISNIKKDFPKA